MIFKELFFIFFRSPFLSSSEIRLGLGEGSILSVDALSLPAAVPDHADQHRT